MNDTTRSRATDLVGPAIVAVTVVAAFVAGSGLWFFSDDWNIYAGWPSGRLLDPFNSHLSLVPIGVDQALFHLFGVGSYVPYRIVGLVAYAVLGWVVWRFGRERLGPLGGALVTAAVLWNSGGVTNVMFPFLMNFSLPVAGLVAIWWHLDRGSTRHDAAASAWLVLALATSGLGLMTAAAVGVELAWRAMAERRVEWRRWAVLAPGPLLWFVWYLAYGVDSPASGGLRPVVSYTVRMLWGGFTSLTGGQRWLGLVAAAAFAVLVVVTVAGKRFDARLAAALAAPVAFSMLTAISRIGVVPAIPPDELRYRWTVGAYLVFAAVLMLAGLDMPSWKRPVAAVSAVAVLVGAVVLVGDVRDWNQGVETAVPGVRANLWVAEVAAGAGVLDRDRALPVSYVRVTAGEYVDAVDELGSPLDDLPASAFGGTADARRTAAQAFVDDFTVVVRPDGPEDCGSLSSVDPAPFAFTGTVRLDATDGPAEVRLGFSPGDASVVVGVLDQGEEGFVTLPDLGDQRMVALLDADGAAVTRC